MKNLNQIGKTNCLLIWSCLLLFAFSPIISVKAQMLELNSSPSSERAGIYFIGNQMLIPKPIKELRVSANEAIGLSWDWKDLFEELEYFEQKSSVLQLCYSFRSNVDLKTQAGLQDQVDVKGFIPGLALTYERQVWNNIGLGLTLGTQVWKVPIFNYQYQYYTGGLRATYHINVIDKLDPYLGIATTYRFINLTNFDRNIMEGKITAHFIMGCRYYFSNRFGVIFEYGGDATSWFKVGLSYYLPKD